MDYLPIVVGWSTKKTLCFFKNIYMLLTHLISIEYPYMLILNDAGKCPFPMEIWMATIHPDILRWGSCRTGRWTSNPLQEGAIMPSAADLGKGLSSHISLMGFLIWLGIYVQFAYIAYI